MNKPLMITTQQYLTQWKAALKAEIRLVKRHKLHTQPALKCDLCKGMPREAVMADLQKRVDSLKAAFAKEVAR